MRITVVAFILSFAFLSVGCVVYRDAPPPRVVEVDAPPPDVQGPVIEGPGVEVITQEPPPVDRVYVYDVGYPPGCYFYNGYYWYGHYRYEHDVFIDRYVTVNVREHRYVNVEQNRRMGAQIEHRHQIVYRQTGGRQVAVQKHPRPAARPPESHDNHERPQ